MVVMDSGDLLTEVSMFLKVTLGEEKLTDHAENCRQKLIAKLAKKDMSPPPAQAYIDMNGGSYCHPKIQHQNSNCYEEFDRSFDTNIKSKTHIPEGFMNNLYNNLSSMQDENIYANNDETENYINIQHVTPKQEDNPYINPTSALANTPVIPTKPSLVVKNPSNSNSERNSVISFKKDSPDRISVSSGMTSNSTRCEDSPDMLTTSASALRYAASKTGMLGRREKFLFMDHTKFYWVALLNQTLFLFNSDKDTKPVSEMDISGYKARPVAISANTKPDFKFELVSPGKKTHQFCAEKQSDMIAWISVVNAATNPADPTREWARQLPSPPVAQNMYDQPGVRRMTCPVTSLTYDQLDCAKRPLVEAEYELPDALTAVSCVSQSTPAHVALNQELTQFLNSHTRGRKSMDQLASPVKQNGDRRSPSGRQSISPRETRRLPLLPHQQQPEPYDKLISVRPVQDNPELYESLCEEVYHCIENTQTQNNKKPRQLPLLPHEQETYDQPEPTIRPVNNLDLVREINSVLDTVVRPTVQNSKEPRRLPLLPHEQETYDQPEPTIRPVNNSEIVQEEFYSVIDSADSNEPSQEALYKNLEDCEPVSQSDDDSNYYNLVPYPERETDQECIYDVITEQRQLLSPSPNTDITHKVHGAASAAEQRATRLDVKKTSPPVVNNMATIFSRPFTKPLLREVKSPIVNKSYQ